MDKAERSGLGIALLLHALLFGALSLNLLKAPASPVTQTTPIEVTLSDEVAPISGAPVISPAAAPPTPEPVSQPLPPPPAPMARPDPQPLPKPAKPVTIKPATKTAAKPAAKPSRSAAKPAAQPARRPALSRDILAGLRDSPARQNSARPAAGAPAATISAAVKSSIGAEVRRQLKPHWKSPTGADVELLRTTVSAKLNRDGSLDGAPQIVSQSGVNDSNRAQARLHADQAIKAVRLAAPFKLPTEFYEAWREIRPNFDKRLSQ